MAMTEKEIDDATSDKLHDLRNAVMELLLARCNPTEAGWVVKELLAGVLFCAGSPEAEVKVAITLICELALKTHAKMRAATPKQPMAKA